MIFQTTGAVAGSSSSISNSNNLEIIIDVKESNANDKFFKRQIEKVSPLLRNNDKNKGEYDPKVVSIGPYHHGKPELQLVQSIKPVVARLFVSDSDKDIDKFYEKVLLMVDEARSCYVEGSTDTYSDEKFAEMMLLDGCFILGMFESYNFSDQKPARRAKYDVVITQLGMLVWLSINSDVLFLLENQLPFQVLELLMSLKYKDAEGMTMIYAFLENQTGIQFQTRKDLKAGEYEKQPLHIFQLFRTKLLLDQCGDGVNQPLSNLKSRRGSRKDKYEGKYHLNVKDYIHSFRSITELKAKGIQVRPISTKSQKAINFRSFYFYGLLELPPFIVTLKTKMMLSNMIAYELSSDNANNLAITSYVGFLKSLIDHSDDVKELQSRHILFSRVGSDEEVANVFKEITTCAMEDYGMYGNVTQSIQEHYNSKMKTWMAELIHNHFRSPWTVVAFIAASSIVVLSFTQSYFTVFPRSRN